MVLNYGPVTNLVLGASNNRNLKFMKMMMFVSSRSLLHPLRRSARKFRSSFGMPALLMTAAALLGPGGWQRCAAQFFPAIPTGASSYQYSEQTFSIGVFQIQVDPNFGFLFAPDSTHTTYYPGYSPSSGVLTSPVMYDADTWIATGGSAAMNWPGTFPVQMGDTTGIASLPQGFGLSANNPGNQVANTGDYYVMPIDFAFPPSPYQNALDICTEIISFDLSCDSSRIQCGTDERVPLPPGTPVTLVSAGPLSLAAFAPSNPVNLGRRSLGMVQQYANPTAAKSFFNINVQVDLPAVLNTATYTDFPLCPAPFNYGFGVAQLTNDPYYPLVIINTNVTKLPPDAVYIHGLTTTAVPLYFLNNNPPYWTNGALFGYITLAGHGVFACTNEYDSNCCAQVTAQSRVGSLLDQTLGPVGNPRPPMPVPWTRPDNSFPNTNTTYKSIVNIVVDTTTGHTNVLDAAAGFTNLTLTLRDLVVGGFPNPIAPPAVHANATFTATNVPITLQIVNGGTISPSAGTGAVMMVISNTGTWSQTLTNISGNPPPITIYTLQLAAFNYHNTNGGPVYLRLQTNNPSVGQHTIRQTAGGYSISSFFDVWLELSTDNVNWYSATNSLRLLPSLPPVTPGPLSIARQSATSVVLTWPGVWTLQSRADLVSGTWMDVPGPVTIAPYTNAIGPSQMFFRLLQ